MKRISGGNRMENSNMKKLLIVVDMQNDFIDGSLGTEEAKQIVPAVVKKIEEYQGEDCEILFTMDTHYENYLETLEGKKLPVVHCQKGTQGWELCPEIAAFEGTRFEKPSFASLDLGRYVGGREYISVELAGLCTDICVISNAMLIKAVLPGTPVKVDSSCCAGVTPESHKNALEAMKMCQIDVL